MRTRDAPLQWDRKARWPFSFIAKQISKEGNPRNGMNARCAGHGARSSGFSVGVGARLQKRRTMNNQKKALLVALAVAGVSVSGPMVKWSLSCGASPVMIAFGRMALSFALLLIPRAQKRRIAGRRSRAEKAGRAGLRGRIAARAALYLLDDFAQFCFDLCFHGAGLHPAALCRGAFRRAAA